MMRIPPVPAARAGWLGRLVYRITERKFGQVPDPIAVSRHHRRIFWTGTMFELANEHVFTVLDRALVDLVIHRVSTRIGCSWCIDFGTMLSQRTGMSMERLTRLDDYATSPAYTDDEKAALAYADAMVEQPIEVTDEQVADLRRRFGDAGVVELTWAVSLEQFRSRTNHALGLTAQGFTSGDACAVPGNPAPENPAPGNVLSDRAVNGLAGRSGSQANPVR